MKNNFQKFLDLARKNPDLEVIPIVGHDVVGDDYRDRCCTWGDCRIEEILRTDDGPYIKGRDPIAYATIVSVYGADATDAMTAEEVREACKHLPWQKVIVIHITGR